MPILHHADKVLGCTVAVWHGIVTIHEMGVQLVRLAGDPDWPPGPRHLVDATTLETLIVPDPELVELLYEGTELFEGSARLAIVVRPEFLASVTAHHPSASGIVAGAMFTDIDSACAYLGVDPHAMGTAISRLRALLQPSITENPRRVSRLKVT